MAPPEALTGGCQCGAIRYRIAGEPSMYYACHCSDCRRQSASAFGLSLRIDPVQLEFTAGRERLRSWDTRGDDGEIKRCAFCPDCGTRIYHGDEDPAATISVKAGSLDDALGLAPIAHIWLKSALPWVEIDRARFRCFDGEPQDEAELERLWRAQRGG